MPNHEKLLRVEGLATGYGRKQVVADISMHVHSGEIVAFIGHNGSGKTTVLRAIFGLLPAWEGHVTFNGQDITNQHTKYQVQRGLSLVLGKTAVFPDMNVAENIKLAGYTATREQAARAAEDVLQLFPVLRERSGQFAGSLSGGEQRMLSLAMALMTEPRMLLLDEPSLGLAPSKVDEFMHTVIETTRQRGLGVLLVEQNIEAALRVAQRVYVLRAGRIILEETASGLIERGNLWELF